MFRNKIKKINNSYEDSESPCTSVSYGSDDNTNMEEKCFTPNILSLNELLNPKPLPEISPKIDDVKDAYNIQEIRNANPLKIVSPHLQKAKEKSISPNLKSSILYKKEPPAILGDLITENSCNAVDCIELLQGENNPSTSSKSRDSSVNIQKESILTFNGIIDPILNQNKILAHDTRIHMYKNEKSPDLFEDDEDADGYNYYLKSNRDCNFDDIKENIDLTDNVISKDVAKFVKTEEILLKRLQMSLTGVVPPPNITISQINLQKMIEMYRKYDENAENKLENDSEIEKTDTKHPSLLQPTYSVDKTSELEWPDARTVIGHGIYYNRSKYSEKFEALNLKYVERYIGAETSSSFTINQSPTSAKKRNMRLKILGKSPGNRLSHLARRRAIFSSENLANKSICAVDSAKRQILVDNKKQGKHPRKTTTPKRRTPGKRRTPNSRQKKLATNLFGESSRELSRESSKRALFQSPPKTKSASIPSVTPEVANRVQKSKRVLFSPEKFPRCSSFTINEEHRNLDKYKPRFNSMNCLNEVSESSQNIMSSSSQSHNSQMFKRKRDNIDANTENEKLTPTSLKFQKSQSFCVNNENRDTLNIPTGRHLIYRSTSEIIPNTSTSQASLTDHHTKKLLWAVCHALKLKNIGAGHENFKQFAAVLARATKKLYLEFEDTKTGSTSDKMMNLTNRLVFHVIQGKNVEQIYNIESQNLNNIRNRNSQNFK